MIANVLSIAGTDPSGRAGIQADLKTFSALGAYGMSVITTVVASGQVGTEPVSGISFVGRSMIADPWGTVVATASDVEDVVTASLDLGLIETIRKRYPLLDQRRPELFGPIVSYQ